MKYEDIEDLDIDSKIVQTIEDAIEYSNIIEINTKNGSKIENKLTKSLHFRDL